MRDTSLPAMTVTTIDIRITFRFLLPVPQNGPLKAAKTVESAKNRH